MYCNTAHPTFVMYIYSVNRSSFRCVATPDSAVSFPSAVENIDASFLATDLRAGPWFWENRTS